MKKPGPGRKSVTPEQAENAIIGIVSSTYPALVHAFTVKYGREAFETARSRFIDAMVQSSERAFPAEGSRTLKDFHAWLSANICVGHVYEVLKETEDELEYRFTGCPWAQYFRAIGEQEIGKFFCDVDEPMVRAFNPKARFERTKTLMDGDAFCNHHYRMQEDPGRGA